MQHQHWPDRGVGKVVDLDVLAAAAQPDQDRVLAIGKRDEFVAASQQTVLGGKWVIDPQNLDLCPHDRLCAGRGKAAIGARQLGHIRGRRHNRGLLDRHRNEVLCSVHNEICRHAQWQLKTANHVFDHAIGKMNRQRRGV
jgi:hypothetical protein